jgi:hypothetical protein
MRGDELDGTVEPDDVLEDRGSIDERSRVRARRRWIDTWAHSTIVSNHITVRCHDGGAISLNMPKRAKVWLVRVLSNWLG